MIIQVCALILRIYLIVLIYNMIQKRFLLFMLLLIAIVSSLSSVSILIYFDPYVNMWLGIGLLFVSLYLSITSFIAIVLYFCKKIYFRWAVYVYNVVSSVRQASFIWAYILGITACSFLNIPLLIPAIFMCCMFTCLELFIRSIR